MKDHNLYLKYDVSSVFEKFRNNGLKNYGLCPSHYLSTPVLIWDVMFNMTKMELILFPVPNMYIFFEKDMRGGVSYISDRYSKTNNKHFKLYEPKQESKHIYLDANNLYGYAMSKCLPTSGFKWIVPKEFDLNKCTSNSSKECVLQVNPEYSKEFKKLQNDYPLAPDKIQMKREMLSDYQLKITNLYNIPIGNVKKLVPNFFDIEKYVIHYENLQLFLRLGLKLKIYVYRVLEFSQSQWLKNYVEFKVTKKKKRCTN